MNKEKVISSIKIVMNKMSQYGVDTGRVKSLEDDWPRSDLREMINTLESNEWSDLNRDVLSKLGFLSARYSGKGEVLEGYISRGIISLEEAVRFSDAITYISKELRRHLNID